MTDPVSPAMLNYFPLLLLFCLIGNSFATISSTIITTSGSSTAGESYTLTCTVMATDTPTITWRKGSNTLNTDADSGITVGDLSGSGGTYTKQVMLDLVVAYGGVYTCNSMAGGEAGSDTETVNVQMPIPVDEPLFVPNPLVDKQFSGTELGWRCLFGINTIIDSDSDIETTITWNRNGAPITGDSRVTISSTPTKVVGTDEGTMATYSAPLAFDYLRQSDSGLYNCTVNVFSSTNTEYVTNSTLSSADTTITIRAPTPNVTLSSSLYRVPSHSDYNSVTLTCSDTLPLDPQVDELEFDKKYTWTMDSTDVSSFATGPTTPEEIQSMGQLECSLAVPGDVVFICEVSISVPEDPVVSGNKTVTITVLVPAVPDLPTNVYITNTTHTSVTVHWTVPILAYTPEQYLVLYGTSLSSLTSTSTPVNSTTDYSSQDEEYSVQLTGLSFNTLYYYQVRSNNTEGTTESNVLNFTTLSVEAPMGAPRDFSATPASSTRALLRWRSIDESARNGDITVYSISCNSSQPTKVVPAQSSLESSTDKQYLVNITNLFPYTTYFCKIYANNSGGSGPSATTEIRTFEDRPSSSPSDVVVSDDSPSSVIVRWSLPESPNGIITQYTIYVNLLNGTTQFEFIGGTVTEYRIAGLRPYQLLEVRVSASTRIGEGPRSKTVQGRSGEARPSTIVGVAYHILSSSRLKVNFTAQSTSITNGIVLHYNISVGVYMGEKMYSKRILGNASAFEVEFIDLRGEVPYIVTVFAINSAGEGETTSKTLFTREGVPPPPTDITAVRLNGTHMNISWVPVPLIEAKGFISTYSITYTRDASNRKRQSGTLTVSGEQTFVVIGGLSPSARYSVIVQASTSAGMGTQSAQMTVDLPTDTEDSSFFTLVNILIIAVSFAALLVILVLFVLGLVICRMRQKSSKADLPVELGHKVVLEKTFEMAQSPAYGQLVSTPEPDKDMEPSKVAAHFTALNPTYGKPYEHTYESIDNIIASRGGIQMYDTPKPQLPAPRTNSNGSTSPSPS